MSSTFKFKVSVPRWVQLRAEEQGSVRQLSREEFYAWAWQSFESYGLLGVHQGTLLSEEAAEAGLATDSWTVDSGEAPRERDWVSNQDSETAELYFDSVRAAEKAAKILAAQAGLVVGGVVEQKAEDWDANWKASFKGVQVEPFWHVLPPWEEPRADLGNGVVLRLNPGAGFGTGTHETTQLCLGVLGRIAQERGARSLKPASVLDFGSGSGILAIGAALLGAEPIDAVEIDPLAIENAEGNADLNDVRSGVSFARALGEVGEPGRAYNIVLANILRPVLLEFAPQLVKRILPGGRLILSGLIASDVEEVSAKFGELLGGRKPRVLEKGEWRALVW